MNRSGLDAEIQDRYYLGTQAFGNAKGEPAMSTPNAAQSMAPNLDPTVPAPMTNVAEYGFEGRFEDWADWGSSARYFEYSKAANPIGSGHAPQVPIRQFSPEMYLAQP